MFCRYESSNMVYLCVVLNLSAGIPWKEFLGLQKSYGKIKHLVLIGETSRHQQVEQMYYVHHENKEGQMKEFFLERNSGVECLPQTLQSPSQTSSHVELKAWAVEGNLLFTLKHSI